MKRLLIAVFVALPLLAGSARAADMVPAPDGAMPMSDMAFARIEAEIVADARAAPAIPEAVVREWRSFDRDGSALGVLGDLGWIALAAIVALLAERGTVRRLGRRPRRRIEARETGPTITDMAALLLCDLAGLAVFVLVFTAARRHALPRLGVTDAFAMLAMAVLLRWRVFALVLRAILRPRDAIARLIEVDDTEARRLYRFVSLVVLAIVAIVGFGRYGLMDEDSGAAHVVSLSTAFLVFGLYALIVLRSRAAMEALIRGRRTSGIMAKARSAIASVWVALALGLFGCLMVVYVAGLSLDLLSYYYAITQTLGILFVLIVLDRLTERVWHDDAAITLAGNVGVEALQARTTHHIVRAIGLVVAVWALASIWIDAIDTGPAMAAMAMRSSSAALGTLLAAFIAWELIRLAIDRHLVGESRVAGAPGIDDDDAAAPASRLQTVLPLLRAAFAVVIGVLAALIVLSRLGVDTAPLIAGAGVFGLALSFGSQSLVRDIISGLFYMWDDAFRVGEYIDTGRLRGTVETIGIRSVKLRHQNGPLHTIPYGQLGAVSNLSRDFATIKFNLRFEPGTDIELVRKTAKQIGIDAQAEPEIAAEVMLPLKLQGIAEVADNALVLRFKFTARPVKPTWVQREYLKRIYKVFGEKGIAFASGATLLLQQHVPAAPPDDAGEAAVAGAAAATAVSLAEAAAIPSAAG
ncbi:MAG TPA: mechanosensitive ion channel domain-containing protein [Stellaceae bacterium]|nr:mechanosensitive ion channel domain-containing protein [Stellaceae bacterium]